MGSLSSRIARATQRTLTQGGKKGKKKKPFLKNKTSVVVRLQPFIPSTGTGGRRIFKNLRTPGLHSEL